MLLAHGTDFTELAPTVQIVGSVICLQNERSDDIVFYSQRDYILSLMPGLSFRVGICQEAALSLVLLGVGS